MLKILRTMPATLSMAKHLDAVISLRHGFDNVPGCPDIPFSIRTYDKISNQKKDIEGNMILLPINQFLDTLNMSAHRKLYDMYKFCKLKINELDEQNLRELQDVLEGKIFDTIESLHLAERMISFCATSLFVYPDLRDVGKEAHHTPDKTYEESEYIEVTAISLVCKLMIPIWGEFIQRLKDIGTNNSQPDKLAFDLIEQTLEEGAFARIYRKLSFTVMNEVMRQRKSKDEPQSGSSSMTSSFIITHNAVDDQMFDSIVMATILVKRMATYESSSPPVPQHEASNAIVYITKGIRHTVDHKIQTMRSPKGSLKNIMPHSRLQDHDTEDNSSIIDHISRLSKKPIDGPIFVTTAVEHWELPKLLIATGTPVDLHNAACDYYLYNSFDISPLCQSLVASFIGNQFGGSKCLNWLPAKLYQQIVVLLQIFLLRHHFTDLAALVSSHTKPLPGDLSPASLNSRLQTRIKSSGEYKVCHSVFKGYVEKPVIYGTKQSRKPGGDTERIDFVNVMLKMVEWLVKHQHVENMAPVLWEFSKIDHHPNHGEECKFDENIINDLCRFYLMFHEGPRPF